VVRRIALISILAGLALHGQSRIQTMHAPAGQSDQLPPEARQGAALRSTTITVRVVLEGGESLTVAPLVMESKGDPSVCRVGNAFSNGNIRLEVLDSPDSPEHAGSCLLLKVMVPGYQSFSGVVHDGKTIPLKRLGEHEGSSVSITSLRTPAKARKAYERGESAILKHKWPDARKYLDEAVALYPEYAMAWSELGLVREQAAEYPAAAQAYEKAASADPKYIKPLVQLAGLSSFQKSWNDEMRWSEKALKLHPVDFPAAYYYFSEASFHLGRQADAETALRGLIRMDQRSEYPQAHVLLASVLTEKGDRVVAQAELREYLRVAPKAADAADVRARMEQLATASR